MAGSGRALSSYLSNLLFSLLFIILQLGCFVFSSTNPRSEPNRRTHKRKSRRTDDDDDGSTCSISSRFSRPSKKLITTSWSFLKRVFSSSSTTSSTTNTNPFTSSRETTTFTTDPFSSPNLIPYSTNSSRSSNLSEHSVKSSETSCTAAALPRKRRAGSRTHINIQSDLSSYGNHHGHPPLVRNTDIHPCPSCGEIFYRAHHLDQHQTINHAVSELQDGDPGKNIVWIIFKTGWPDQTLLNHQYSYSSYSYNNMYPPPPPVPQQQVQVRVQVPMIYRILKIQNSGRILARFEEYRDTVKAKAAERLDRVRRNDDQECVIDERCVVDGNELLRFHCTTVVCGLGEGGEESVCGHQYCSLCGIIKSGFSGKLDGVLTSGTSWGAHLAVPGDVEVEFGFMSVKRAMLVCRVVAGRVGYELGGGLFDSVVVGGGGGKCGGLLSAEEELVVFNPRAVLPCFVIVYSM